jgi:hypothetical protein
MHNEPVVGAHPVRDRPSHDAIKSIAHRVRSYLMTSILIVDEGTECLATTSNWRGAA